MLKNGNPIRKPKGGVPSETLAASEGMYGSLDVSFPIGISRWRFKQDEVPHCLFASVTYYEILGIPPQTIQSEGVKAIDAILHPDDLQNRVAAWQAMRISDAVHMIVRIKNDLGGWKPVEVHFFVPERFADGSFIFHTMIRDVSEEIEAKRAIEENVALRQRMALRTVEAQRLESLGHLAGGIAHDFNNLLGSIQGFTEFAIEDAHDWESVRRHLARVIAATERGKALVDQILVFAKSTHSEFSECSPVVLFEDAQVLLPPSLSSAFVVDVQVQQAADYVRVDRARMGQVLVNLIVNACDSYRMKQGRRVLTTIGTVHLTEDVRRRFIERVKAGLQTGVETWQDQDGYHWLIEGGVDEPSDCVSFSVEDWGTGIDADVLPQIFTPFFTTKERGQGTGFGLSIIHGVVMAHRGAVIVRTKVGYGTRVEVLVPKSRRQSDCQ